MRVGEDFGIRRRFLALVAAVCTLGSLAVTPLANAADGEARADDAAMLQVADAAPSCTALSLTANGVLNKSVFAFNRVGDTQVTLVGFADVFKNDADNTGKCFDLTIPAQVQNNGKIDTIQIGPNAFQRSPMHFGTLEIDVNLSGYSEFADSTIDKLVIGKNVTALGSDKSAGSFSRATIASLEFNNRGETSLKIGKGTFQGVKGLASIAFPYGLTSLAVANNAFQSSPLSSVTYPKGLEQLSIGTAAFQDTKIGAVSFPDSLKDITIGNQAFYQAPVKSVTFPEESMDNLSIGNSAFWQTGIKTVTFPEKVNEDLTIGDNAFRGEVNGLGNVVLPKTVGGNMTLGGWSFVHMNYDNLEGNFTLTLPETINGKANLGAVAPNWVGEGAKSTSVLIVPKGASPEYWENFTFTGNMGAMTIQHADGKTVDLSGKAVLMSMDFGDGAYGPTGFGTDLTSRSPRIDTADGLNWDANGKVWTTGTEKSYWLKSNDGWDLTGVKVLCAADNSWRECTDNDGVTVTSSKESYSISINRPGRYLEQYQWQSKTYNLTFKDVEVTDAPSTYSVENGVAKLPTPKSQDGKKFLGWTWESSSTPANTKITYSNQSTPVMTIKPGSVAGNLILTPVFVSAEVGGKLDELQKLVDEGLKAQGNLSKPGYAYVNDAKDPFIKALDSARDLLKSVDENTSSEDVIKALDALKDAFEDLKLAPVTAPGSSSGVVTIPTVNGVDYQVDGKTVTGTVTVPSGGTVTVTAVPQKGYAFTAGTTTSFSFSYDHTVIPSPSPNPNPTPSVKMVDVRRLYNPQSGEHFYTAGMTEYTVLVNAGWRDEGMGFTMAAEQGTPVYRLYNPGAKHLFTTSVKERDVLVKAGWRFEGVAFYVPDGAKTDVYRLYNPGNGDHLLTTSANERGVLVMHKWRDEGIAFKAQ